MLCWFLPYKMWISCKVYIYLGFLGGSGKESACQCRRQIWFLGWEDPLKKEMTTHYSILAWEIPWIEEPGRLHSIGSQRVGHDWVRKHPSIQEGLVGEGRGYVGHLTSSYIWVRLHKHQLSLSKDRPLSKAVNFITSIGGIWISPILFSACLEFSLVKN